MDLLGTEFFGREQSGGCLTHVPTLGMRSGKIKVKVRLALGGKTSNVEIRRRFKSLPASPRSAATLTA